MVHWLRIPAEIYDRISLVISIGNADGWREEHYNYGDFLEIIWRGTD